MTILVYLSLGQPIFRGHSIQPLGAGLKEEYTSHSLNTKQGIILLMQAWYAQKGNEGYSERTYIGRL